MSKIEVGQYSSLLRRILGMKGVTDVAPELSPEISPAFILEAERPEWEFLKNAKLMASVFALAGVAGQNSVYRLRNPAGSGVLAVVTQFICGTNVDTQLLCERDNDNNNLATVLATVALDTRFPQLNASALIASQAANIALSGEAWFSNRQLAETSPGYPCKVILTPGHEIDISTLTLNTSIRGCVWYLERRLDVMER